MTTEDRWQESLRIRSRTDGLLWPAMPDMEAVREQAILFQLEQSQWFSPEEIRRRQLAQATLLLRHALRHVPAHRERLGKLPAMAQVLRGAPIDEETWLGLPLLTRKEIQDAGVLLEAQAMPKGHGRSGDVYTSGSTGKPVRVKRSELFVFFWRCVTMRNHLWHGRDLRGTLCVIRGSDKEKSAYPEGQKVGNWGGPASAGMTTGPSLLLSIATPLADQLEWIQRNDPHYLMTHPTNVRDLAELSIKKQVKLPRLRQVMTVAELCGEEVRDAARRAWGVGIGDIYSSRDVGYMALQCPENDHYHVQAETTMVEVLDQEGRPCGPGETGRVVVTPLHNFAMPLLRYDIGDFAEVGGPCSCGRGLPVLTRLRGRQQQLLRLPDGNTRWTLLGASSIGKLLKLAPIRQYQFVQQSLERVEIRLVTERPLEESEEEAIRDWARATFAKEMDYSFRYYDEIPRSEAGKYADFVCEVKD